MILQRDPWQSWNRVQPSVPKGRACTQNDPSDRLATHCVLSPRQVRRPLLLRLAVYFSQGSLTCCVWYSCHSHQCLQIGIEHLALLEMPPCRQREQEWAASLGVISREIWWTELSPGSGFSSGLEEQIPVYFLHALSLWKNWFHLRLLGPLDNLPPWMEGKDLKGAEGKYADFWRDILKRHSCSRPRGLVALYRRMVCSAWLEVLAGSALKSQNIVYAAEIQFSHCWREARLPCQKTAVTHTCALSNKHWEGVLLTRVPFFFSLLFLWSWSFPSDLLSLWLLQDESHSPTCLYQMGLWKVDLTNVPYKEKMVTDAF